MFNLHILEQSLVFLPLALGVFLSYTILKKADLTVDGSFVLGAGVFAKLTQMGYPLGLAMGAATATGCLAGMVTALVQYRNRISPLIAGILVLFILQSVNLTVMGRPNISLLGKETLFSLMGEAPLSRILLLSALSMMIIGLILLFLQSSLGLMLRAFGCNPTLVSMLGKRAEGYRLIGLAASNGLVAFCGSLTAQFNGYADIGMGTGLVLIGIGTVIIGQQLLSYCYHKQRTPMGIQLLFCVAGVLSYFIVVNLLVSIGMNPIYLKMMIGIALVAFLFASRQELTTREIPA